METHILFFVVAGLLIAILVGYSLWSARRDKSSVFSNTFSTRPPSTPMNNDLNVDIPPSLNQTVSQDISTQSNLSVEQPSAELTAQETAENVKKIHITLPGQEAASFEQQEAYVEQPTNQNLYQEPRVQVQPEPVVEVDMVEPVAEPIQEVPQAPSNIVTLYVVAPEGQQFHGSAVAHNLEDLGFHFGEHNIFHRHVDNSTSPVLFSVANLMQPGSFDIANMDNFATVGLVFFMYLPSTGNDVANVRFMIRTAESLAQAMGGFVLDDQYQIFTEETRQAYSLRVKQG
ncbi:cell division protein ZipA [Pasteurellaceae bacterium LFhippo2]|nr:cell division protein ZipA [Pasteurellaceae bacterium LFhippo2]